MLRIRFVANNELSLRLGLMNQEPLNEDECALFEFPRIGQHSFWNKNVAFPISLIFCDANKTIRDIARMDAQQEKLVTPKSYDIKYVIEAHSELPTKLGLKTGKKFQVNGESVRFDV